MKIVRFFLLLPGILLSQISMEYMPDTKNPFGTLNPDAPTEVADFEPLIGTCDCISTARKADQSWGEPQKMIWTFKYIMNGMAVQDETLKEDGIPSGSIRQFIADSSKWYVHYYTNARPSTTLPTWEGGKRGDSLVFYREQKAPNGMDGSYRLTFSNISNTGFDWVGEWVDTSESIVYPTWKIECKKRHRGGDRESITRGTKAFSKAYVDADYEKLANMYTIDGKIFPNNSDIISGREAIKNRWILPDGVEVLEHKVSPSEVNIIGNYAYDYGYYEGKTSSSKNEVQAFKGKYVIVWRKTDDQWKIYLDIWNRL